MLELRNPHSILAALTTRLEAVSRIELAAGKPSPAWQAVLQRAARHNVPVVETAKKGRGQQADRSETGRGGQSRAQVKDKPACSLQELFTPVEKAPPNGLWLALDRIQDPHNLGAIFRSAAFFGVQGILMTRDRSAPMNQVVYDVASGGVEHVPFAWARNLARDLQQAKQAGLWILGTAEDAEQSVEAVARDRPWLVVLGNEEKGLRRLSRDNCDATCRLVSHGPVGSLNVSVAAGVVMAFLRSRDD